ncbi:MAG: methyltransferase domain-containing protein [Acidobacteria bacterium]|nr:methyltransferase domain-containing protein [Acidobacteriota bacterium]
MLVCPVRNCRASLERKERTLVCGNSHSFDVARSGYVNLLQPQDKRSKQPGDSAEAVAARRRLHDKGVTQPLLLAMERMLALTAKDSVLEAGCGEGFFLGGLVRSSGCRGCGVDISTTAIEAAARRYAECEWIVANADRFVPYADGGFSVIVSIAARRNPDEFRRVLKEGGRVLIAVPAPDDLIELRGKGRDRVQRTVEEFAGVMQLVDQDRATTVAELDAASVQDVLHSIYRPMSAPPSGEMRLTFSLDLLVFR